MATTLKSKHIFNNKEIQFIHSKYMLISGYIREIERHCKFSSIIALEITHIIYSYYQYLILIVGFNGIRNFKLGQKVFVAGYDAVIKEIMPGQSVKVAFLDDKWADEKYDEWIKKSEWSSSILSKTVLSCGITHKYDDIIIEEGGVLTTKAWSGISDDSGSGG
eukprot:459607_1